MDDRLCYAHGLLFAFPGQGHQLIICHQPDLFHFDAFVIESGVQLMGVGKHFRVEWIGAFPQITPFQKNTLFLFNLN